MEIAQLEGLRKQPRFFYQGRQECIGVIGRTAGLQAESPEKFTRLE